MDQKACGELDGNSGETTVTPNGKKALHSTGVQVEKKNSFSKRTPELNGKTTILTATKNDIINQQCKFFTYSEMELK